jgi:hypothetical protein
MTSKYAKDGVPDLQVNIYLQSCMLQLQWISHILFARSLSAFHALEKGQAHS